MGPTDIQKLLGVGRPALSSRGEFAVFSVSRPDLPANRMVGQLWRIDLPDGAPRRLTRGVLDTAPALSPDDTRVAFLRPDARGRSQVFVIAAPGGEPVQATDAPLGVGEVVWTQDGRSLVYTARMPEVGRYGTVEGLGATAEAPRRITGVRWNANGLGYLADRPAQIFVIAAPEVDSEPFYEPAPAVRDDDEAPRRTVIGATPRALTEGQLSWSTLAVAGEEVLAVPDLIEADRRDLRTPIVAHHLDGSGRREALGTGANLSVTGLAVADDGAVAALASDVGTSGTDFVAPGTALYVIGEGEARVLTDPETIDLGEVGSHVTPIGDDFLVQDRRRGRVRLLRVARDGSAATVIGGDREVLGHAASGSTVVAAVATPDSFGEMVLAGAGEPRMLTAFGAAAAATGIVEPRELTVRGRDGYPVHGWVARPAGDGPFPVILQIHGGPYASYGIHLFDETQVLVDAGYAVVYCNPRGSAGYGRAHGRAIRQAMGTLDHHDVIDFLDGALESDTTLDPRRLGIMGGSYGGYLTAWIIAHDHRFRGAIVERGFLEPTSFQGTSDIGSFFGDEYVGVDPERIAAQSPMAVVGQVRTPTLVMHAEADHRCPLEQATRYYSALTRAGVPSEMLIFPGENHELTRSGQPRHRVERFVAVTQWWARHLPID
ncbi:prolyl oligopeptidase family serine peptidase [Microbacterium sp. ET2]|uniref:prolyl oligopeptidase family serine peptidase n=1 Tax=Microbacterium albipurpureum TaxID=3050384 RepID=UPI00259CABD5|nr:prolyl oligopeptidase family serine peptidase [Microbacterium sp. ET2 (Ac-2212)]WJL95512.1 prolyl oligopeptidase family serine peptidase [Microbacterium sp. ET2 (Ac-2212)]